MHFFSGGGFFEEVSIENCYQLFWGASGGHYDICHKIK